MKSRSQSYSINPTSITRTGHETGSKWSLYYENIKKVDSKLQLPGLSGHRRTLTCFQSNENYQNFIEKVKPKTQVGFRNRIPGPKSETSSSWTRHNVSRQSLRTINVNPYQNVIIEQSKIFNTRNLNTNYSQQCDQSKILNYQNNSVSSKLDHRNSSISSKLDYRNSSISSKLNSPKIESNTYVLAPVELSYDGFSINSQNEFVKIHSTIEEVKSYCMSQKRKKFIGKFDLKTRMNAQITLNKPKNQRKIIIKNTKINEKPKEIESKVNEGIIEKMVERFHRIFGSAPFLIEESVYTNFIIDKYEKQLLNNIDQFLSMDLEDYQSSFEIKVIPIEEFDQNDFMKVIPDEKLNSYDKPQYRKLFLDKIQISQEKLLNLFVNLTLTKKHDSYQKWEMVISNQSYLPSDLLDFREFHPKLLSWKHDQKRRLSHKHTFSYKRQSQYPFNNRSSYFSGAFSDNSSCLSIHKHKFNCRCNTCLDYEPLVRLSSFNNLLKNTYQENQEKIDRKAWKRSILADPIKAKDVQEIANNNIKQLFYSDEQHLKVQEAKDLLDLRAIKQNAEKVLHDLENGELIQKSKNLNFASMFLRNNVASLVFKFVANLKRSVIQTRDKTIEQKNQQYVGNILKQTIYKKQYKEAEVILKKKVQKKEEKVFTVQGYKKAMNNNKPKVNMDICHLEPEMPPKPRRQDSEESDHQPFQNMGDIMRNKIKQKMSLQLRKEFEFQVKKMVPKETVKSYISKAISEGIQPLPILNRINDLGELFLLNYQLNSTNSQAFIDSLPDIIPFKLNKLVLINNKLTDEQLSQLFLKIRRGGLTSLCIDYNEIGEKTIQVIQEWFLWSEGASKLKKLVLKNPVRQNPIKFDTFFSEMSWNSGNLEKLSKLTVSQFYMDNSCLEHIIDVVQNVKSLYYLDVSGNKLDLNDFMEKIRDKNHLRYLNIAYNHGSDIKFCRRIANFIHYSNSLLHIDLSGLNLKSVEHVWNKGIKKARTLLSCHFGGIYKQINIKNEIFQIADVDKDSLNYLFAKQPKNTNNKEIFTTKIQKLNQKMRQNAKSILSQPAFDFPKDDSFIFSRILGHSEVYRSHNWTQSTSCIICQKLCYCILVWNNRVQKSNLGQKFYNHSYIEPIKFKHKYEYPVMYLNGQVHRMMPMVEFVDRLKFSKKYITQNVRAIDNEYEQENFDLLREQIEKQKNEDKSLLPTYWHQSKSLYREERKNPKERLIENFKQGIQMFMKNNDFDMFQNVQSLIPKGSFAPIDLKEYAAAIEFVYQKQYIPEDANEEVVYNMKSLIARTIPKETFFCSFFMPCHHAATDGFRVAVKTQEIAGIDYFVKNEIPKIPKMYKHLSINTRRIYYKQTKKIQTLRHFCKAHSIFAEFKDFNQRIANQGFEIDKQFLKNHKFIKDQNDLQQSEKILRKYCVPLFEQFYNQIGTSSNYPSISWLDYVSNSFKWKIVGQDLTSQDIDRTFIATNYSEVAIDNNDDKTLCRYEYLEIVVRLAKIKYFDRQICPSVASSTEKLITEYIIPNTTAQMELQSFRETYLWTLDVDDMMRTNINNIDQLYNYCRTTGKGSRSQVQLKDIITFIYNAGFEGIDYENKAALAFSLSKMFIVNEMQNFNLYNQMKKVEFYEFLGRIAYLIYSDNSITSGLPLSEKIAKLLQQLFRVYLQQDVKMPDTGKDLESDSDYEDDIVEQILHQLP